MPNYNFNTDLPIAHKTEREIANLLKENFKFEILEFRNDNKYDIKVKLKNKEYTIEIKEDFTCEKTRNVGVEYSCREKDSGITVTEADLYLYKIHEPTGEMHYYLMPVYKLKKLIENKVYHRKVNGGDFGSNSLNYLFYLDDIQEISLLLK